MISAGREAKRMDELCTYRIEVRGQVDEKDLNAISPLRLTTLQVEPTATFFTIHTDQSGLIGLLRHLHGRGLIFLSVQQER